MINFVEDFVPAVAPTVNVFISRTAIRAFLNSHGRRDNVDRSGALVVVQAEFPQTIALLLPGVKAVTRTSKLAEEACRQVQSGVEIVIVHWFEIADDATESQVTALYRVIVRARHYEQTYVFPNVDEKLHGILKSLSPGSLPGYDSASFNKEDQVGQGANGTVYLMRHKETNELVALKEISDNSTKYCITERDIHMMLSRNSEYKRLFVLLRYLPFYDEQNLICLPMEYCKGHTLWECLPQVDKGVYLREREIRRVMYHVAFAVKTLHDVKCGHRDLQLNNVLVLGDNIETAVVKLCDFGLAKLIENSERDTKLSMVAPVEPFANDLWCLGVLTFQLLYGIVDCRKLESLQPDEIRTTYSSYRAATWEVPSTTVLQFIHHTYTACNTLQSADVLSSPFLHQFEIDTVAELHRSLAIAHRKLQRDAVLMQRPEGVQWLRETVLYILQLEAAVCRYELYKWEGLRGIREELQRVRGDMVALGAR